MLTALKDPKNNRDEEDADLSQPGTQGGVEASQPKNFGTQQELSERRRVRAGYRDLLSRTEENKEDVNPTELLATIKRANSLFRDVYTTHEATLDSRLLVTAAELAVQQAQRMRLDGGSFNIDDWLSKVAGRLTTHQPAEQEDPTDASANVLNWSEFGDAASTALLRAPTTDFMLGPLAVEVRVRAQAKRGARLVVNKEDLRKPQELKEDDFKKQENETTTLVLIISKRLEEVGVVPFFEFVLHPTSFAQSVENMFYVSFMIRDGTAVLGEDEGELLIGKTQPEEQRDFQNNNAARKQAVMDLDQATWRGFVEAYDIKEPCIPNRETSLQAAASGKWYG
ncbi:Nse4 C-terminal-domain-containing protein [Phlyctochytrium arcticum]|nr:Nse4 C-terminal-domain-containing protein [Phlyctochytrium arcticum]